MEDLLDIHGNIYHFVLIAVALGSIPELPAESCKEIKDSEGQAVSGRYWMSSLIPGKTVSAHCDMKISQISGLAIQNLPESIRNCKDYRTFLRLSRNFLRNRVQSH